MDWFMKLNWRTHTQYLLYFFSVILGFVYVLLYARPYLFVPRRIARVTASLT